MLDYRVAFIKHGEAGLIEARLDDHVGEHELLGRNLVSMISTGSERGGFSQIEKPECYPIQTGYASIAEVISVGEKVQGLKKGDLVFHNAYHTLYVKVDVRDTIPVPAGLAPEKALFARFAAVSMTSVYHSKARPVDDVIVTGLGIVGLMCAQMMNCFGFRVYATDPSAERREIAGRTGLVHVAESLAEWPELKRRATALFECSGNENALKAAIPYMHQGGELFQIGVPWKKLADWDAHELLYDIFYGFLSLHGGWEWSIPRKEDDFHTHSNDSHIRMAMECIAEQKVRIIEEMYELRNPRDCGTIYQEIMIPRMKPTSIILDWRKF